MWPRHYFKIDNNKKRETFAVVASLIDWSSAFPRQCPKLGIESFIQNGVRSSLIPILINYFQDRQMRVKWNGSFSKTRKINGGGPQGATIGILEYLSQSNDSADFVNSEDRYKYDDDLTMLETVNLLTIGLSTFNFKSQIPNDIGDHNQYIDKENLQTQQYLTNISNWTDEKKMQINEKKSKIMIFNYTNKYQFSTRLSLKDKNLEEVSETKLLGTIVTNDLKWHKNTQRIIKKANARMQLLRILSTFNASWNDLKTIYVSFIRSLLEQSCTIWHSGLTNDNRNDLERVQKSALKIILKNKYKNYQNALNFLELENLENRREFLCLKFAKKALKNKKMKSLFIPNQKSHEMETRNQYHFNINNANTFRLQNSPIIYMQKLLNDDTKTRRKQ